MTESGRRTVAMLALAVISATMGCGEPVLPEPDPDPLPEPGYELRIIGGNTHTVPLRQVLPLELIIERIEGGYEGPVTFTAEAPPGIVVIFRPSTVLVSNATDILLVAEGSVVPKRYQLTFRGTAPERRDQTVVLDLTLTPAP